MSTAGDYDDRTTVAMVTVFASIYGASDLAVDRGMELIPWNLIDVATV